MSKSKHLLAQELHPFVDNFPPLELDAAMLPGFREQQNSLISLADAEAAGVAREQITVSNGDFDVPAFLYQPPEGKRAGSGYLHIHGGGYVIGSAASADANNIELCAALGVTILSVDYRLAPEHPYPAPLEDCYAGLKWLHVNADRLGVDPARIAIGGESAGGGLAAATAIFARDRGEYAICHQQLTYPMLDSRTGREGFEGDPLVGEFIWTRSLNRFGWDSILRDVEAAAPYVPALVEDVSGLPPTWIHTVGLDLFRDENIAYAQRLLAAGIPTELIVMPGACHGFQMFPGSALGKEFRDDHRRALTRALG